MKAVVHVTYQCPKVAIISSRCGGWISLERAPLTSRLLFFWSSFPRMMPVYMHSLMMKSSRARTEVRSICFNKSS